MESPSGKARLSMASLPSHARRGEFPQSHQFRRRARRDVRMRQHLRPVNATTPSSSSRDPGFREGQRDFDQV